MVSMVGPSFRVTDDVCVPQYSNVGGNLTRLSTFQPREKDYILCSYPKSGTHWVNEIVSMLVSGVDDYETGPIMNLESGNYGNSDELDPDTPRVLHTHLPHDLLPDAVMAKKIVYVMRDPRDQLVSLYHHHQGLKWSPVVTFKEFFEEIISNPQKVEYGTWFRNAYQWWLNFRYSQKVLILTYEGLIQDLHHQIQRIVDFYNLELTPEFVSAVTTKTRFKEMKQKKKVGDWFSQWHKDSFSIYRKGGVGNWEMHFTPEMENKFQRFCLQNMVDVLPYSLICPLRIDRLPANSRHSDNADQAIEHQLEVAMAH